MKSSRDAILEDHGRRTLYYVRLPPVKGMPLSHNISQKLLWTARDYAGKGKPSLSSM